MNIKDLLNTFPDMKICSGEKGINNNIVYITVMDAPDIYNWMHGGEFLITSGYVFKNEPERFKDLIIKLKEKNIAALGIKVDRFIRDIPEQVLNISDKLELPLINIPTHYAFSDIISPGMTKIINMQFDELFKAEKIHKEFTSMGIHNNSISQIIEKLEYFINRDVAFYNHNKKQIISNSKSFKEYIKSIINLEKDYLKNIYSKKIVEQNNLHGYIFIDGLEENLNKLDLRTIDYAETMIRLNIQKEISNNQVEERYKDQFILDIIMNNIRTENELNSRAKIYGWNFASKTFCLIINIVNYSSNIKNLQQISSLLNYMKKYIYNLNRESYYLSRADSLTYLITFEDGDLLLDDFIKNLRELIEIAKKDFNSNLCISLGNVYDNFEKIHLSYNEALIASKNGKMFLGEHANIVKYKDIDMYWKFINFTKSNNYKDNELLSSFDKLKLYDFNNNTEYLETLKHIIKNDWNLKEASKKMYIHYNTSKYRFTKIKEILNNDLSDRVSKFNLEIGLYIHEIEDIST